MKVMFRELVWARAGPAPSMMARAGTTIPVRIAVAENFGFDIISSPVGALQSLPAEERYGQEKTGRSECPRRNTRLSCTPTSFAHEAVSYTVGVGVGSRNRTQCVDARWRGGRAAWWIEDVEGAVLGPQKAVLHAIGVSVRSRNGALPVNASRSGACAAWRIEGGEGTIQGPPEAVFHAVGIKEDPVIAPSVLMPDAAVPELPGTSILVKVPVGVRTKPFSA